jgi:U3 small nucleolar RNA-associated protein 10
MSSILEQQLRSIAIAAGLRGGDPHASTSNAPYVPYPSILYEQQEAADIHIDQLYAQASQAFDQLNRSDPRFSRTRKVLFSPPQSALSIHEADEQQKKDLNSAVDVFCRLLQPHFLQPSAQHALEYLIRKFHVHDHNVLSLLKAALPYHSTPEFFKLVRVCRIEGTMFSFLAPMREKGASFIRLNRDVLVQRAVTDRSLLRFVCDMAQEASSGEWKVASSMGWYAVVVCEVITAPGNAVDEAFVSFLLPYVVAGLKGGVLGEYRDATFMIVGRLSGKSVFSEALVQGMCCALCAENACRDGLLGCELIRCLFERLAR